MNEIMTHYEIRQQVSTVTKKWLEVLATDLTWKSAQSLYDWSVAQAPDCYFELVKINRNEERVKHNGIKDQPARLWHRR